MALLIDRQGYPLMVLVGDPGGILIPELPRLRLGAGRLRGLRLLHTHLSGETLSQEDLMDMVFLRLDSVGALTVSDAGEPERFQWAHLLPPNPEGKSHDVAQPARWDRVEGLDLGAQVAALEEELARLDTAREAGGGERALLVSVAAAPRPVQERSLEELAELARTAGLAPVGTVVQRVSVLNSKFILGKGKLADLEVRALQTGAAVILFEQDLSPSQLRNLADLTERRVLDRTQLILDIFAQHATSRAGKLQVEMAQLKYALPRLVGKNRAMSRLVGGIGGRGPGETKLEIDRRRARDRIARLKKELEDVRRQRGQTRERRAKAGLPVVSLVGYTNAGKSTLLNTLTQSGVLAENRLFATLDPTSRRIRFPRDREVVLTDTVGFIRRLPPDLREAFRATLEELESADVLVHVADASHAEVEEQIEAVESILRELELDEAPRILALNKWDLLDEEARETARRLHPQGIPLSALERPGLEPLVQAILNLIPWDKRDKARAPGE
ncbi:GTPase HflX [Desulfovibrio aminophilus]|uniref:GTPase HflX n=1 Tax=Desulfovibrio aminophilus TaxID=81425 RepID=UPI0003F7C263|nr:GTPase HflX [Desulfovibrio aminophilus]